MSEIFKNAASLAKALAIQIAAGCPITSSEEQKERHDICKECTSFIKDEYRCGECKCYLRLKIPLQTSKCPKGYWENKNE